MQKSPQVIHKYKIAPKTKAYIDNVAETNILKLTFDWCPTAQSSWNTYSSLMQLKHRY